MRRNSACSADSVSRVDARRYTTGVTLYESIVTLGVASIIGITAMPTLRDILAAQRMTTAVNEFITGLTLARTEAITRGRSVLLCPGTAATGCRSSTDWHQGFIVFSDENDDNRFDASRDVLIRSSGPAAGALRIGGGRRFVQYQPSGLAGGSNQSVSFCDARGPGQGRVVIINLAGRPYVSKKRPDGTPPEC
jgi:type IV fimbrial biogenesis protein FimT